MSLLINLPGAQDRVRGSLPQLETFQGASKATVARTFQRELGKEVWTARPLYRERPGAAELWWILQLIRSAADSDLANREGLFARYRSTSGYRRAIPQRYRKPRDDPEEDRKLSDPEILVEYIMGLIEEREATST